MKKFKLAKPGTDEDVLGGTVSIDNVYISPYGEHVSGFEQSCIKRYSLSGQKPTEYKIVRVE